MSVATSGQFLATWPACSPRLELRRHWLGQSLPEDHATLAAALRAIGSHPNALTEHIADPNVCQLAGVRTTSPVPTIDWTHGQWLTVSTKRAVGNRRKTSCRRPQPVPDSRLEQIAAQARSRGWEVSWHDTADRTELVVVPAVSNAEQQGFLGFGVGVRAGGVTLACWAWEAWSDTLIEPWLCHEEIPQSGDESLFPTITDLEGCCRVFDRGVGRYMTTMRRTCLNYWGEACSITEWADLDPLAQQGG